MDKLGMELASALAHVPVQGAHGAGDGVAVGAFYRVQKAYERLPDPFFHGCPGNRH